MSGGDLGWTDKLAADLVAMVSGSPPEPTGVFDGSPLEPFDVPRPWQPVDLTDVLAGTYRPPEATVGVRDDGVGMFYPGRQHTIASESEGGKTWLVLAQAAIELGRGNAVVFVDFEDDEGGVVGRLLALGAHREAVQKRFAYIRPESPIGATCNRDDLHDALRDLRPTLAILDGVTEAMVMHGLNPLDNKDAAAFGRLVPRYIAEHGPATVCLDHVTKDREGRGRYALGAVHKLNGLNGAAYLLDNRTPFGVGITGKSSVLIAKDRPGQLRRHAVRTSGDRHWFGDLVLTSHDETFVEHGLTAPTELDDDFRPTVVMTRIAAAVAKHGPLSQRKILAVVKGNRDTAIRALTFLQLDGYVSDKTPHALLRPYPPEAP